MTARPRNRTCPRCGVRTGAWNCCGIDLTVRRAAWVMSPDLIKRVHMLKAQKGLDDETYRLRLIAVGVDSCKKLSRQSFGTFMAGLSALPDRPGYVARTSSTARMARG